jgi:hypothetical protein
VVLVSSGWLRLVGKRFENVERRPERDFIEPTSV